MYNFGGNAYPITGATHYHAQLGHPDKYRAMIWMLVPSDRQTVCPSVIINCPLIYELYEFLQTLKLDRIYKLEGSETILLEARGTTQIFDL